MALTQRTLYKSDDPNNDPYHNQPFTIIKTLIEEWTEDYIFKIQFNDGTTCYAYIDEVYELN